PRYRTGLSRKTRPEHRCFAPGRFLGGLVLKHIPVFLKDPVLDAEDVGSNPIHGRTTTAESPVNDDIVAFSHNQAGLVLQRGRSASHQIEQAVTAWFDMSAVLDVARRPVAFRRFIVTLVEQRVEGLKNESPFF